MLGLMGVLAVLATVLLAGCGSSEGSESSSEEATASSEQAGGPGGFAEISEETRSCLKEKGAELPESSRRGVHISGSFEGGPPEGGPPTGRPPQGFGKGGAKMKKAFEECGVELPQGKPEARR